MILVGITSRVDVIGAHKERRDCLDQRWISFLNACGIQAVILPNNKTSIELLSRLDGVILSGGNTLVKYGGDAPERDMLENEIISWVTAHKLPLIGVCRGMQIMIDYVGETLIETPSHVAKRHLIKFPDTNVSRIVNSYHTLGTKNAPSNYDVSARSEDGLVEAMKHKALPFYGIMWHPEREETFSQEDIDLFIEIFKHD